MGDGGYWVVWGEFWCVVGWVGLVVCVIFFELFLSCIVYLEYEGWYLVFGLVVLGIVFIVYDWWDFVYMVIVKL